MFLGEIYDTIDVFATIFYAITREIFFNKQEK